MSVRLRKMNYTSKLLAVIRYICRAILVLIAFFFASFIFSGVVEAMIPETWIDWVQGSLNFRQSIEGYYDAWELIAFLISLPTAMLASWLTFRLSGYLPFLRP
ncbi:hypothetical protein [Mangrovibacter phragmitis]|uniref:hypothetical protein n=1 Tax=Mangrovibacter phragmitis TaxID=1691903 RepID=UPI00336A0FD6